MDGRSNFWVSLKKRLEHYSLRERPSRMKDNHWEYFCKSYKENGWDIEAARILDNCEIAA